MLSLTKQERLVLLTLAMVLFFGSISRLVFKMFPELSDIVNFVDKKDVVLRVNVNTASREQLLLIPGVGEKRAQRILDYRQNQGPFVNKMDVQEAMGVGVKTFNKVSPFFEVR